MSARNYRGQVLPENALVVQALQAGLALGGRLHACSSTGGLPGRSLALSVVRGGDRDGENSEEHSLGSSLESILSSSS